MQTPIYDNTAILIFHRSPAQEVLAKPLFGKSECQEKLLYRLLNQRIKKIAQRVGLPIFSIGEKNQSGTTFGIRLGNAIQFVFDKGYESVVIVGNDCLQLSVEKIRKAARQLTEKKNILGPTYDGGTYLIGLQKCHFDYKKFVALPWQTDKLFETIALYFNQASTSEVVLLPKAVDIDDAQSFVQAVNQLPCSSKWKNRLTSIFNTNSLLVSHTLQYSSANNYSIHLQRGPPISAFISFF
mgnify:CR=1 FL=1